MITQVIDEMGVHSIMLEAYIEEVAAAKELAWKVARTGADLAREGPEHNRSHLVICQARAAQYDSRSLLTRLCVLQLRVMATVAALMGNHTLL